MENETGLEITLSNSESDTSVSKKVNHNEEAIGKELGNSTSIVGSKSCCLDLDSNSDTSYCGNDKDGDDTVEDEDYISEYDDNDEYMFNNNDDDDDEYLNMQAQFDNVDLPPGVEASVSWLKDTNTSTKNVTNNNDAVALPAGSGSEMETSIAVVPNHANPNNNAAASSSSTFLSRLSSDGKEEEEKVNDVIKNYLSFKRFDIVDDLSDHHYSSVGFQGQQPPKSWAKKIHDEWKILEDLPDTIYVRVCEARMDLLRAVIIGPAGTPYHDGLFVFDVLFPSTYPDIPPMVYYYSGGLRLNPNLYDCGKVCLSLLNTWTGNGNEKWMPKTSTMLQVLVSIQALILNAKPFFNEPGYEDTYTGKEGERRSKEYNENTFILSLKTMIYTLRRPPKHYEDFVAGHFRTRARDILLACRAYMEGAEVGLLVDGKVRDGSKRKTGSSTEFKAALAGMVNGLVSNFTRNGSKDCEEFRRTG